MGPTKKRLPNSSGVVSLGDASIGKTPREGLLLKGGLTLIVTFFICLAFMAFIAPRGPLLGEKEFSNAYYAKGGELLKIYPTKDEQYRLYRHISSFSPSFKRMILLQEDRYFYNHWGVNLFSLGRAFYKTYIKKERRIGGSTITMQLARLCYHMESHTIGGKIKQIGAALYLELFYSKQEILEAYLNLAPCGGNIQGFPAASLLYFGKPLGEIQLGDSLLLCVLPQDPNGRYPRRAANHKELLHARNTLYKRWQEAYPEDSGSIFHPQLMPKILKAPVVHAPHFTQMLQQKDESYGSFTSSIDYPLQVNLEERLSHYVQRNRFKGVFNGASVIIDSRLMEVRALVGSADYFNSHIHGMVNGVTSRRSPGSTLKPFVYALALDQGLIHSQSILFDRPISFSTYSPDNYKRDFKGPVPAWNALVNSRNIPAVELASKLQGTRSLYDLLKESGVGNLREESHYGLSIVLGSAELSMLELCGLYGSFLNRGDLKSVSGGMHEGHRVLVQSLKEQRLISPESSFIVKSMLERNPPPKEGFDFAEKGPKGRLPVAYKTGTSVGFKDAWTIGMVGPYIIGVWIGNFSGEGNPAFLGRDMAGPLLFEIVQTLKSSLGANPYEGGSVSNVKGVEVCAVSGKIPTKYCEKTIEALFIPGVSPIEPCDIHRPIIVDKSSGLRLRHRGQNSQKIVREVWPSDMLKLFEEAGVPRPVPPPYEAQGGSLSPTGESLPPRILSPLQDAHYILRPNDAKHGKIPLTASADGDVRTLYWFEGGRFIGKTEPKKTLYWEPDPGRYHLILLDDKGLSTDRWVIVEMEP